MPYGIPNETPAITAKMERCVRGRMKEKMPKKKAIKICKASIMKARSKNDSRRRALSAL